MMKKQGFYAEIRGFHAEIWWFIRKCGDFMVKYGDFMVKYGDFMLKYDDFIQIKDQFHNDNFASRAVMARDHEFDTEFKNVLMKQMVSDTIWYEPEHDKTNEMTGAPSEYSDQPGHSPSLISLRCLHEEALADAQDKLSRWVYQSLCLFWHALAQFDMSNKPVFWK